MERKVGKGKIWDVDGINEINDIFRAMEQWCDEVDACNETANFYMCGVLVWLPSVSLAIEIFFNS